MRDEVFRVMQATSANKSSMLQDVEAKRATEIDFINGFIARRAGIHGLPCAHHQHLLNAVRALHS
jgi:2-dehydropantoate 2-reductase